VRAILVSHTIECCAFVIEGEDGILGYSGDTGPTERLWQVLNKVAYPQDARFSKHVFVVAPGLTVRNRLRVLLASDPDNYYDEFSVIPAGMEDKLRQGKVLVRNWQALAPLDPAGVPDLLVLRVLLAVLLIRFDRVMIRLNRAHNQAQGRYAAALVDCLGNIAYLDAHLNTMGGDVFDNRAASGTRIANFQGRRVGYGSWYDVQRGGADCSSGTRAPFHARPGGRRRPNYPLVHLRASERRGFLRAHRLEWPGGARARQA